MRKQLLLLTCIIFSFSIFSHAEIKRPCIACHPSMKEGYKVPEFTAVGNIYETIAISCPDYAKLIKEKYYSRELIMKSEELLAKLTKRNFYTVPLERALVPIRQQYLEINQKRVKSLDEYTKKNQKLRFELDKTYLKLADYDWSFRGRTVFTIIILISIVVVISVITGWKNAHNKRHKELKNYLNEQEMIHTEKEKSLLEKLTESNATKLSAFLIILSFIALVSFADNTQKDPAKDYLSKLDSIVVKMENYQAKCQYYLELNSIFRTNGLTPKINLVNAAKCNWDSLENLYKGEYLNILKSSSLVGDDKANINTFNEMKDHAESAYDVWLFREILLAKINSSQDLKSSDESKISNLISYYKSRNCSPVEIFSLAESIKDISKDKANELVASIANPYFKAIGLVRIGDLNSALTLTQNISEPTEKLDLLLLILNSKPDGTIKEEAMKNTLELAKSGDFLKENVYYSQRILETITVYSPNEAQKIIDLIPEVFPDIKLSCLLTLKEFALKFNLDERKVASLLASNDNHYAQETLSGVYGVLKSRNSENPFPLAIQPESPMIANQMYMKILIGKMHEDQEKYFEKADELLTDPTMLFNTQLMALETSLCKHCDRCFTPKADMTPAKGTKLAMKLLDKLYSDLANVPDKSVLAELIPYLAKIDAGKAADKIAEVEKAELRCRLYGELSSQLHDSDINLSEVLFKKAFATYDDLPPEMDFIDRLELLSRLTKSCKDTKAADIQKLLDNSVDLINKIN